MAKLPPFPGTSDRRDWRTAREAIGKLMSNGEDTVQVFRIMRALNAGSTARNYARMLATEQGGRLAYRRIELAERFVDPGYVASFAPGTVGAAYREFLARTGYSADGLADISKVHREEDMAHPYAWFGRRVRDCHDVWHVLTGYQADESMGEAALVAFSYAQLGGLGWAAIGLAAALKSVAVTRGTSFARSVWEGYRRGRRAGWLIGEDMDALLHEPLAAARRRLRLAEPVAYRRAQRELGAALASYLTQQRTAAADRGEARLAV